VNPDIPASPPSLLKFVLASLYATPVIDPVPGIGVGVGGGVVVDVAKTESV